MNGRFDFEFYVSGLEAAILALLKDGNPPLNQSGMKSYVNEFATYSGELDDRETLINSLKGMTSRFPLILASYGSGTDIRKAATGLSNDDPIEFDHRCGFVVIVVCNDLRGESVRKSTAFKMVSDVRQLLGGIQFEIQTADDESSQLLNHAPFEYAGVETIGRLKDLTAMAVHFATSFREWTPNRRTMMIYPADEILLDITPVAVIDADEDFLEVPPLVNTPGVSGETN